MSVNDVMARVQELQHLIHGRNTATPKPNSDFATTLAATSAPAAATAAASSPLGIAGAGIAGGVTASAGSVSGMPFSDEINAAAARHKLGHVPLLAPINPRS